MLLEAPFTEKKIRALRVGDRVEITGLIYTGRDAVHKYLHDGGKPPVDLTDSIIYHCGPVVVKEKGKWVVKAAGPTTSIREEPYQGPLMEQYGIRAVIGKGGMGPKTLKYCKKVGA
ncbi:MAG: fumarate hydratase C-terminal domain-containing protein, partial [Candidatus Krumholzibacteria bacterium]|nr:fumarate hydratase C-terminal domain-containing protein [Candidatus Krumholzibacteria bacterium]